VRHYHGSAVRGAFERETVVEHFEQFLYEKQDSYREYAILDSPTTAMQAKTVAAADGGFFFVVAPTRDAGQKYVRALIDTHDSVQEPFVTADTAMESVVSHLPQGVFTRVYGSAATIQQRVVKQGVTHAGQTVQLEGSETLTFRTVLMFGEDAAIEAGLETLLDGDHLLALPLTDPTVVERAGPGLVVIEDESDISTMVASNR